MPLKVRRVVTTCLEKQNVTHESIDRETPHVKLAFV